MFFKMVASKEKLHAQSVAQALKDWQSSVRYFESVRDPALVDYAAYSIEAARRRYMVLLKGADHVD